MYGVMDESGDPCLVPPKASPLRSETWLPLSVLLERIKAHRLPDDLNKLLVLDCTRQLVNWNLGLLYNGFTDRIGEVVDEANIPNLVVINATGPGEIGWAANELQGSVFGHYLRLGLAGAADDAREGGNGDRRVSLHELHHYLQHHVDGWVRHHRADRQRPMLAPRGASDFVVIHAVNRRTLNNVLARAVNISKPRPAVETSQIVRLWKSHDQLLDHNPYRFNPLAWHELQHQLLWLEKCVNSGWAYRSSAQKAHVRLKSLLEGMENRVPATPQYRSIRSGCAVFSEQTSPPPGDLRPRSLQLAGFLGTLDPDVIVELRGTLAAFHHAPNEQTLSHAVDVFQAHGVAPKFSSSHFLRLLRKHDALGLWPDSRIIGRAVSIREHGGDIAAVLGGRRAIGDERAHAWARPLIWDADKTRRQAEDALFVGPDAGVDETQQLWAKAERGYQKAESSLEQASQAFRVRDRLLAEVPHLATWLARPLPAAQTSEPLDRQINETLLSLIENEHRLAHSLRRPAMSFDHRPVSQWPDNVAKETASERFATLKGQLDSEWTRLLQAENRDAGTLRGIAAVLSLPLVPWDKRRQLLRKYDELAAELSGAYRSTPAGPLSDSLSRERLVEDRSPGQSYLERVMLNWREHPAQAILKPFERGATGEGPSKPKPTVARDGEGLLTCCAATGQRVRDLLSAIGPQVRAHAGLGTEPVNEGTGAYADGDSPAGASGISHAERVVRTAAALYVGPLPEDPIARLRQYDLQQLLLWHCRRSLDDFWGPVEKDEESFFMPAAIDLRDSAIAMLSLSPDVQQQVNRLNEIMDLRRAAARDGMATTAADVLMVPGSEEVVANVGVTDRSEAEELEFPEGHATVFIRDTKGRIDKKVRPFDVPIVGSGEGRARLELSYSMRQTAVADRDPVLEAVAMFRGHEFVAPFLLRAAGGVIVDHQPINYGPPCVTLLGHRRKRASFVFILDCSSSMKELVEVEAPGDVNTSHLPRLEVAKSALRGMLYQLAERDDVRVGVRFYGHRVGWSTSVPNKLLRQHNYAHEIPPELRPYEDVELVLPLGRFDTLAAGAMSELMTTVQPWAETPLYLAIIQTLGDFADDDVDTAKSIVVVTDGINYQFNAPSDYSKNRQDVLDQWEKQPVPIHIVGFGIPDDESAQAAREFGDLAVRTQGSYVSATTAGELVKSLEALLGPSVYRLTDEIGTEVGRAQIGSTVVVSPAPGRPCRYWVQLEHLREEIELAGGEALELTVSADGRRIVSRPYTQGCLKFVHLVEGPMHRATEYQAGIHRAIWQNEALRFPISIQHQKNHFTRRPGETWVEITPVSDDGENEFQKYIFYDANFEPGKPVPVVEWIANGWPQKAQKAAIRIWCKPEKTKPTKVVTLEEVANRVPTEGTGFRLDDLPGFTYQVRVQQRADPREPTRVSVVERHADAAGVGSVKVEMVPMAQHAVHQFDAKNGLVIHTFYYDDISAPTISKHEVSFTTRDAIRSGSWYNEEPVAIDISTNTDLIRLSPAPAAKLR